MKRPAGAGDARLAAVDLLAAVLDQGRNLSDARPRVEPDDPRDRAFARHLAYGVLRWMNALEWLASGLLQHALKTRDRDVHRLLLIGLYQLWQEPAAAHAAVNEAAGAARLLGKRWAVGLVNAVLRRFQRERSERLAQLEQRDERHAHPGWLLQRLRADWPDDWEAIVQADNRAAPLWLRVAPAADRPELESRLRADGFELEPHPFAPEALAVRPAVAAERLPGFAEGLVSVQDPAAQLAARLLQPAPGQRVLDACAAPGGKACHLLELEPELELTALDRSAERLERVRENLERLGLAGRAGLRLAAADAAEPDGWWDGRSYDRILLDAPCTATGVVRRHPEIKWLRTPQQVGEAVRLQARLLDRLWPLLKAGGILLYATCSVLKDENSRQIEQFLARRPEARCEPLCEPLNDHPTRGLGADPNARWGRESGGGRQVLPGEHGMDGFFYARLRKTA